jgi:hypothetical protein
MFRVFVFDCDAPIVIRLIPFIPTFIPQHLLKCPRIITVPCQKVGCSVNCERLLNVGYDEVVVSALRSGCNGSGCLCW